MISREKVIVVSKYKKAKAGTATMKKAKMTIIPKDENSSVVRAKEVLDRYFSLFPR